MKKLLVVSAILFSFIACKDESRHENHDDHEHQEEAVVQEDNHHHDEIEEIVLDNGNKWKVVETMAIYIRNMEEAVNEFETLENKDYAVLAKTIDENITELTSKCTMEGQAHDELHKWLVPFIELFEEFDGATELEDQEQLYQEFKASFKTYNTYFK